MASKSSSKSTPLSIDAITDFLPGAEILLLDEPAAKPVVPLSRDFSSSDLLRWGPRNDYPQQIIAKANKSPELLALIKFVVYFMYGDGLIYEVHDTVLGNKRPEYVEGWDPEIEAWIKANNLSDYLLERIIDLVWFNHGFTEMIKSKRGNYIPQIVHQEAAFCRFSKQNDQGYNDKVHINAQWGQAGFTDEYTSKVDCLNVKDFNKVKIAMQANYSKFIMPTTFPVPGCLTYQTAEWHALFDSGYYDISILIPIIKRALMTLSMSIKYTIKVPTSFWEAQAKDRGLTWATMDHIEKKKLRRELTKEMNDFLTGAENAGKSFLSTYGWDKEKGKEIPGIVIEPIKDETKDGIWNQDGQEASAQFIRAFNLVPAIVGHMTGKGMGAGSGSDVRVHGNSQNKMMASRRHKALSDLNFIAEYNGFTKRLPGFRWRIKDFQFDTLDKTGSTTNPINPNDGNIN